MEDYNYLKIGWREFPEGMRESNSHMERIVIIEQSGQESGLEKRGMNSERSGLSLVSRSGSYHSPFSSSLTLVKSCTASKADLNGVLLASWKPQTSTYDRDMTKVCGQDLATSQCDMEMVKYSGLSLQ